jgi:3-methyladenine DNA glycosylase AlkD
MTMKTTSADIEKVLDIVREALQNQVDEKTLASSQGFFKETIRFYGVTVPKVNKISKQLFVQIADWNKADVWEICDRLWMSGMLEESFIAAEWAYLQRHRFEPADFLLFEKWIKHDVNNWASCDTLCNHTVGTFVTNFPEFIESLIAFTHSENRWVRRAAAVTLIIPARNGLFQSSIFEIADQLLTDQDDLVQKGYGWMLKAASESDQKAIFDYVIRHKADMPRTALRYAIEKMPPELRKEAMART